MALELIAITNNSSTAWNNLLWILVYFGAAFGLAQITGRLSTRLFSISRLAPRDRRPSEERARTLQALTTSLANFFLFLLAFALSLLRFVSVSTLVWILGLFSAAFGIAAKPIVSDVLAGIGFLFQETFDIGEKVEFVLAGSNIQGVIEAVNLTSTIVRAPTGEQYTLPNGEIRVVRNFSRGKYSQVTITLYVTPDDLNRTLDVMKPLGEEAFHEVADMVEPWQVISTSNLTGSKVELTILARASLGKGPDLKFKLIALIQDRLKKENISILD
jgi:moderate conductance mechanosensitive channel